MKVLAIGFKRAAHTLTGVDYRSLGDTTPFGYDTVIVNAVGGSQQFGDSESGSVTIRWKAYLEKWLSSNHRIIVIIHPFDFHSGQTAHNYNWLPELGIDYMSFVDSGTSEYIGSVVAQDSYVKRYLEGHQHKVIAHFNYIDDNDAVRVNSKIDEEIVTSFSYKTENREIIFIPPTTSSNNLRDLLNSFELASNRWKVPDVEAIEDNIREIEHEIEGLEVRRSTLNAEVKNLNDEVENLINTDIYLGRAVRAYEFVQEQENPVPEKFYEALEAIEMAFDSEREMRDELGFSKTRIGKLTRRTNEFRHVSKSGETPTPLTADEVTDFTSLIEEVISSYIKKLRNDE
jgi:uncharacterized protein YukE